MSAFFSCRLRLTIALVMVACFPSGGCKTPAHVRHPQSALATTSPITPAPAPLARVETPPVIAPPVSAIPPIAQTKPPVTPTIAPPPVQVVQPNPVPPMPQPTTLPQTESPPLALLQPPQQTPMATVQTPPPLTSPPAPQSRASAPTPQPTLETPSSAPQQADQNLAKLFEIYNRAAVKFEGVDSYIARFRRREVVNGKQQPEDLLLMRFRKQPFSIYFKWLEGTSKEGREIVYVKGMYNNQMQTLSGKGDVIAGMRVSVDPYSARATANSRRTIDEAGMGNMIARFGTTLDAFQKGANSLGTLQYVGQYKRPESPAPLECVVQQIPPGVEKHLPRGGQRFWFFSTDTNVPEVGLPVLLVTHDENRREVEYYAHDRFNFNTCRPEDFDPEHLWPKGRRR